VTTYAITGSSGYIGTRVCRHLLDSEPDCRIVGIDVRPTGSVALEAFVARNGLDGSVHAYYGVDQQDVARLGEIVAAEFGDAPLDLVVDDASHLLEPSRATFDRLFPCLRPGGVYVIEDWPMHQLKQADRSLTMLVFETALACAEVPHVVAGVTVHRGYAIVTRGDAPLDPSTFRLASLLGERAQTLVTPRTEPPRVMPAPAPSPSTGSAPRWHPVAPRERPAVGAARFLI